MTTPLPAEELRRRADALGPWFHNMDLGGGVWTAPGHFLGDYPAVKFRSFEAVLPADLTGQSVLDIGCNGGFYSIEMKKRGAERVLGIDFDEDYLAQARFAAGTLGHDIEFRKLSVYDVAALGERFDLVVFMGVLYHLRHPLLALDLIHEHVAGDLMLYQSMQRGSREMPDVPENADFFDEGMFDAPGYPKLHFIENRYADDPTNWWAPNAACSAAMLRSAGFAIVAHPETEVFLCRRQEVAHPPWSGPVYPARGSRGFAETAIHMPPHAEVAREASPRSTHDRGASFEARLPAPPDGRSPQDEDVWRRPSGAGKGAAR